MTTPFVTTGFALIIGPFLGSSSHLPVLALIRDWPGFRQHRNTYQVCFKASGLFCI